MSLMRSAPWVLDEVGPRHVDCRCPCRRRNGRLPCDTIQLWTSPAGRVLVDLRVGRVDHPRPVLQGRCGGTARRRRSAPRCPRREVGKVVDLLDLLAGDLRVHEAAALLAALGIRTEDDAVQGRLDAGVVHVEPLGKLRAVLAVLTAGTLVTLVALRALVTLVALRAVDAVGAVATENETPSLPFFAIVLSLARSAPSRRFSEMVDRCRSRFITVPSLIWADVMSDDAVADAVVQTTPVMATAAIVLYGSRSMNRVLVVLSCCMVCVLAWMGFGTTTGLREDGCSCPSLQCGRRAPFGTGHFATPPTLVLYVGAGPPVLDGSPITLSLRL